MKKYRVLFVVLLLCIFTSCTVLPYTSEIPHEDAPNAANVDEEDNGESLYVNEELRDQFYAQVGSTHYVDIYATPLPEDTPLETLQALYPELNIKSYRDYCFVVKCPKGTPDYGSRIMLYVVRADWCSTEGVTMTVPERISADFESFEIVLEKTEEPSELLYIESPRIDKWVDGAWERIYYLPEHNSPNFYDGFVHTEWVVKGDAAYSVSAIGQGTITVSRDEWITPVEPGRYRVMVYVGYEETPLYAEFAIVD